MANLIYQKLAPVENSELIWENNYSISLKKDDDEDFKIGASQLSGGQLMSASLAIRLALIKYFSDLKIGFLDEPTLHLDKERKKYLAENVLARLKNLSLGNDNWFDQMFIISHDDSFYSIGENIIMIENINDEGSKVVK